jgi:hypothetical protein
MQIQILAHEYVTIKRTMILTHTLDTTLTQVIILENKFN